MVGYRNLDRLRTAPNYTLDQDCRIVPLDPMYDPANMKDFNPPAVEHSMDPDGEVVTRLIAEFKLPESIRPRLMEEFEKAYDRGVNS